MGKFGTRRVKPHGVTLELPDGSRVELRSGPTTARLRGPIGECALYLSGRRDAAHVELAGDPSAVEALRTARLGI
jgi:MDMPI C-terminal domain